MRVIPPIKSIIYFEAAARLQSFKLAAIELNVTSGAISQQIITLESFIGKKLFERGCRQIKLTNCGLRYFSRVSLIIQDIEEATTDLGIANVRPKVKIAVPPSLLKNWLLPRIIDSSLIGLNRNIEFIDTLDYLDFSKCDLDLAIRYGYDSWDNMHSKYMFHEDMIAVCSPVYCKDKNFNLDQNFFDLNTMIYTNNRLVQWDIVMQNFGFQRKSNHNKLFFQNSIQAIEAAIQGAGIAYVNRILVAEELSNGRLVQPLNIYMPEHRSPAYHLVSTHKHMRDESTFKIYHAILAFSKSTQTTQHLRLLG
ncbi:LysR family transcriptional regulator [Shewanella cutis]|uniref:LysR family transcriptional regulator n=1 Tax=Shewanella cutis TaxID=2766780 RepID=A0ABS9R071_9GAMM|nr:LysR family transcriptional regulator [Shewanella sp. PS-2]MCG9966005.1 LysR family transcriptional regulator [Shewanella sp. PS-2]